MDIPNNESRKPKNRKPPSLDPEVREKQLISLAVDLAEKQLREGTASSAMMIHYLKLGSSQNKLEREKLSKENRLLDIKAESLESQTRMEELYEDVLDAMKLYSGADESEI